MDHSLVYSSRLNIYIQHWLSRTWIRYERDPGQGRSTWRQGADGRRLLNCRYKFARMFYKVLGCVKRNLNLNF